VLAAMSALLWWPRASGTPVPPPSASPPPQAPVALYTAAVQGPVETAVAVDASRVYVASGRTVQAYFRADGREAWTEPFTAPADVAADPYVAGDTLYVSARDNRLHLLDVADGTQRRTISTGERDPGPATVVGDALFLGTSGGLFSRYDLSSRERQWRFQTGNAIQHPAAVGAGLAVVSSTDGNVYAFDAEADDVDDPEWTVDIDPASAPVVAGGRVFVGSGDKKLYAIDTHTQRTDWTFPTGAAVESTPAVSGALVYLGGRDGVVYAIEADTGAERWSFRSPGAESFESVQVAAGTVYAAARSGRLHALDAATGRSLWQRDIAGAPGPPRVSDGVLYVGTSQKTLHALRVAPAGPPVPVGVATPSRTSQAPPSSPLPPPETRRPPQDANEPDDGQEPRDRTRRPRTTPPSRTSEPPVVPSTEPTEPPPEPETVPTPPVVIG